MKTEHIKKSRNLIFLALIGVTTYHLDLCQYITVTISPSMISRIYWISRNPEPDKIIVGKYVMFDLIREETKNAKTTKVVKRVACAGGDTLSFENGAYYCNGDRIGGATDIVNPFVHSGVLKRDELFLLGDRPKVSMDSRYWGLFSKNKVIAIVYPIF